MKINKSSKLTNATKLGYLLMMALVCVECVRPDSVANEQMLPNIILVMADDQGWADMGYNDHPILQTPHFDKAAKECLRFNRFYAAAPVCSPTRASVLTGRHPNRMKAFNWGHTLRPQEQTIAELLQVEGYTTGHFGKWHLGAVQVGSPVNPGNSGFDKWFSAPNFFENDAILSREGVAMKTEGESSMMTVDTAWQFIERNHMSGRPYLAVVWFGSPHGPHIAAERDRMIYNDLIDTTLQHFYGEITGMDRAYGKLREQVRTLPGNDNTLIWYCSDNGGLRRIGSTGGRGHKGSIYEGGLRVPAILDWPAMVHRSTSIDFPCLTSDIFPTIAEIVGSPNSLISPLDGTSLLNVIKGKSDYLDRGIGFWHYPRRGIRTPSFEWMPELLAAQASGQMITDSFRLRLDAGDLSESFTVDSTQGHAAWLHWPWKLHRIEKKDGRAHYELYHLQLDSLESQNLILEENQRAEQMKLSLSNWQQSVIESLNGADY